MKNKLQPDIQIKRHPVLVVDDDPLVLKFIEMMLQSSNIAYVTACSVDEACLILKQRPISVVLLDWGLDRPGVEVLRQCRALDAFAPVIVMSGQSADVQTDAFVAQADGFLVKPFNGTALVAAIRWWLYRLEAMNSSLLPQRVEDVLPLESIKTIYIQHVVRLLDGNASLAANSLGIHRHTVSSAISDYQPQKRKPL